MAVFRWGIAGPGRIAAKFAQSLPFSKGKLEAVASTDLARAQSFAKEYQAAFAFGSYREMFESGCVDGLYVATTNQKHFELVEMALQNRVPVLCEKPMVMSSKETQRLISLARSQNTFLMEGLWSLFLPHMVQVKNWVVEGKIGKPVHVYADFGFLAQPDPASRIFDPALGGGVARDIGIYPLGLFYHLLGPFGNWQSTAGFAPTGVSDHVLFQGWAIGGASFQGMVSFRTQTKVEAIIYGEKGRISISSQWLRPVSVQLETSTEQLAFHPEVPSFGFQFEADEVVDCVQAGRKESSIWSLDDSLKMAEYLDMLEEKN